jgi:hypothetical protein
MHYRGGEIESCLNNHKTTPSKTKENTMKDPIITYRGATARLSEISDKRVEQLQQQQATQLVTFRGASGRVDLGTHRKTARTVSYRGATAEMEI